MELSCVSTAESKYDTCYHLNLNRCSVRPCKSFEHQNSKLNICTDTLCFDLFWNSVAAKVFYINDEWLMVEWLTVNPSGSHWFSWLIMIQSTLMANSYGCIYDGFSK